MEYAKAEIAQVEIASKEAAIDLITELDQLQLCIVGGGHGDVSFA